MPPPRLGERAISEIFRHATASTTRHDAVEQIVEPHTVLEKIKEDSGRRNKSLAALRQEHEEARMTRAAGKAPPQEDIKRQANVNVLHVPYGGGPAVQAVLADQSQLTLLSYAALKGQIAAGKIKPLAVTGPRLLADLPDVPTVAESGFPGFEAHSWIGLFVPAATPAATVKKLSDDMRAAMTHPEVQGKLTAAGFEVMASDGPGVERYAQQQHDRWADFVARTKLKIDD